MTNKIIYDWLTFTSKIHSAEAIIDFLGLTGIKFEELQGRYGYKHRYEFQGISIMYDGKPDMGICVQMTGQGCRAFESSGTGDFDSIFSEILTNYSDDSDHRDMNITRIDIAYDDFHGLIDLNQIVFDVQKGNYVSRLSEWSLSVGSKGCSVCHGSMSSEVYIRIYDKKAERKRDDLDSWVRCELQIRGKNALGVIQTPGIVDQKYYAILNNYLRYVVPDANDSNKRRWNTAPYWLQWLESFGSESIFARPGLDYNREKLDNFVFLNAGGAVLTALELYGVDSFVATLKDFQKDKIRNPKYKKLLAASDRQGIEEGA